MKRLPIVLDTDIGTNIDDAYALLLAATAPELDLRGVTTVGHRSPERAMIAKTGLQMISRQDVPVVTGENSGLCGPFPELPLHADVPAQTTGGAVDFLAKQMISRPLPTVAAIGPLTNIAMALRKLEQRQKARVRIVAMAGSLGQPRRETNSALDIEACQEVIESGARIRFVGLNVTKFTHMNIEQVEILRRLRKPLGALLADWHYAYVADRDNLSIPMHDPLTVASIIRPRILRFKRSFARTIGADNLLEIVSSDSGNCDAAVSISIAAFQALFWERILSAVDGRRI